MTLLNPEITVVIWGKTYSNITYGISVQSFLMRRSWCHHKFKTTALYPKTPLKIAPTAAFYLWRPKNYSILQSGCFRDLDRPGLKYRVSSLWSQDCCFWKVVELVWRRRVHRPCYKELAFIRSNFNQLQLVWLFQTRLRHNQLYFRPLFTHFTFSSLFLAVQNSSIGDLVTNSLTH